MKSPLPPQILSASQAQSYKGPKLTLGPHIYLLSSCFFSFLFLFQALCACCVCVFMLLVVRSHFLPLHYYHVIPLR